MRRSRRILIGIALALGLLGAVPGATFAAVLACGDSLTASTTLSADLDCSDYEGDGLSIDADGITLDLNGHTITGNADWDDWAGVLVRGTKNVTITNGTISNFGSGVALLDAIGATVSWLTIDGEVLPVDPSTGSSAPGNEGSFGIRVEAGVGNKIKHVTTDGVWWGLALFGSASNVIARNDFTAHETGVRAEGEAFDTFRHNKAHAQRGFELHGGSGNRLLYNTASNGRDGFVISCDGDGSVQLIGNTANFNDKAGFVTSCGSRGAPRGATQREGRLAPRSIIRGNTANHNGYWGFLDQGTRKAVFARNSASDNGWDGMWFTDPAAIVITRNRAIHNGEAGIRLGDDHDWVGSPAVLSYNTAKWNQFGLYSFNGVPKHVTVGNRVRHNSVENCFNVFC